MHNSKAQISEMKNTLALIGKLKRHKNQVNQPFESDAEILKLSESSYLVATVDAIVEEFNYGLIKDPKTMGWLVATASVSDMAAVGVMPDALLISLVSPKNTEPSTLEKIYEGLNEACEYYDTKIIGGDTGSSNEWNVSCTALAVVNKKPKVLRVAPNEEFSVYCTGKLGWGNAIALANVLPSFDKTVAEKLDAQYRPEARLKEGKIIAEHAAFCMDTSDGLIKTLDFLCELNPFGICLNYDSIPFHPVVNDVSQVAKMPRFLFAAGENGEFELIFGVNKKNENKMLADFTRHGCAFTQIGQTTLEQGFSIARGQKVKEVALSPIRNLLEGDFSPQHYIESILNFAKLNDLQQ